MWSWGMVLIENLLNNWTEVAIKDTGKWNWKALQFLSSACHVSKLDLKDVRNGDKQTLNIHRIALAGNLGEKQSNGKYCA